EVLLGRRAREREEAPRRPPGVGARQWPARHEGDAGERVRARLRPRAPRARLPRPGDRYGRLPARLRADRARQREGRARLPDDGAGRVRVRGCAARAVAGRVGDLGGAGGGAGGGRVSHGRDVPAGEPGGVSRWPAGHSPGRAFAAAASSPIRHEYANGEIFALAGSSVAHNHIAANILTSLRRRCWVRRAPPSGAISDWRRERPLHVPARDGDLRTPDARLVEVLSEATRDYDRGEKLAAYRAIPTLREVCSSSRKPWWSSACSGRRPGRVCGSGWWRSWMRSCVSHRSASRCRLARATARCSARAWA